MLVNDIRHFLKADPIDYREAMTLFKAFASNSRDTASCGDTVAKDKIFYGIAVCAGQVGRSVLGLGSESIYSQFSPWHSLSGVPMGRLRGFRSRRDMGGCGAEQMGFSSNLHLGIS